MTSDKYTIIPGAEPFHLPAKGSKILLIHGFTATPTEMRPIGDFLNEKGIEVYSILLPGHGTAPEDLQTKKWMDWWEAVKRKVKEIDGCDFIVGFSTGALLASKVAVHYSKNLKGLILLSTFMRIKPKLFSTFSFLFPLIAKFKPYINKGADTEQFFKDHQLISYTKYPIKAAHETIKLIHHVEKKVLNEITVPTLMIQGEKDDRIDPQCYKILMKKIAAKEKKLVLLPNSQHIVTVGPDKDLLFQSIYDFIKSYQ